MQGNRNALRNMGAHTRENVVPSTDSENPSRVRVSSGYRYKPE